jgi:GT2 family glycosyltransferase
MISIICCTNNLDTYEEMLLQSLKMQKAIFEIVLIDNKDNTYLSGASALNAGAKQAKGEYFIFAHQDISFIDPNFLNNIVGYINDLNAIVGVAGILDGRGVVTNLKQGIDKKPGGEFQLDKPYKVQTLDEVFIACHRSVFEQVYFDENTCNDWHLYGVDFCLTASEKGIQSYVIPDEIYHKSSGKISLGYAMTLRKVLKKHRKSFDKVYTTCTVSSTKKIRSTQYIISLVWDHVIIENLRKLCQRVF